MPIACTTVLPTVRADDCLIGGARGQIDTIYFTRWGDPLTDWTDPSEWTTRLDQDDVLPAEGTDAKIRKLNGIGSWTAPEQTTVEASLGRTFYFDPRHTVNFAVDDTGTVNYAAAQTIAAANGQLYAVWIVNGDWIFGGNDGIPATMTVNMDIPEGRTELRKLRVTLTWEGAMPAMIDNPIV